MQLRDPRDFHFIAVCLSHELATAAELAPLLARLAVEPGKSLGELLLESRILNQSQYHAIQELIITNPRLHAAIKGEPMPAAARTDTVTMEHEDISGSATIRLDGFLPDSSVSGYSETAQMDSDLSTHPSAPPRRSPAIDASVDLPETLPRDLSDDQTAFLTHPSVTPPPTPSATQGGTHSLGGSLGSSLDSLAGSSRTGHRSVVGSFSTGLRERRPAEELVGYEIAGFIIEGVLGKGGQGQVLKARQRSLDRMVALKILPPDMASDNGFIGRFIREARTLANFTHPNIVQVYDVGEEDGVYYFAMEAVRGQSLKDLLASQGKYPVEVGVNLLKQCLRGLERAAQEGIIHRDIKPGNLMIDDQGIVKIADFGLAEKVNESGALESSRVVGTPLYISPEQIRGRDVTSKADQYSLGASFYHLFTGSPPFQAKSSRDVLAKHLEEPIPDPCELAPEIHPELGTILQRMLAKDPAQRFDSFQDLFKVLEDFELRTGLIESRSSFLSEGLINIGERSVRALGAKVGLGILIGVATTLAAIGTSEVLDRTGHGDWKGPFGNVGAFLLMTAFVAIMYIAGVRKKWFPKFGNVRLWLQVHIVMALTGYFLSQVHSGNFFAFFTGPKQIPVPGASPAVSVVPIIPFLNSILFTFVVASGLVGRYIWRDIANQVATDRIQRGLDEKGQETHELTLSIFAQRALRYWRIFHYPMAFALVVVTVVHVLSILYWGGGR